MVSPGLQDLQEFHLTVNKPTYNCIFKKVFKPHSVCLIELLNAIYHVDIKELTYIQEEHSNPTSTIGEKSIMFDLHCVTESGTRFIVEVHNYSSGPAFLNRLQIYSAQSLVDAWRKISSQRGKRYDDVPNVRTLAFVKFGMDWLQQFRSHYGIHDFSFAHIFDNEFVKVPFLQDYTIVDLLQARRSLASTSHPRATSPLGSAPSSIGDELKDWLTFLTREDQEEVTLVANPSSVLFKAYLDASILSEQDRTELEREKRDLIDNLTILEESERRGEKRGKKMAIENISSWMKNKGFSPEDIDQLNVLCDYESDS